MSEWFGGRLSVRLSVLSVVLSVRLDRESFFFVFPLFFFFLVSPLFPFFFSPLLFLSLFLLAFFPLPFFGLNSLSFLNFLTSTRERERERERGAWPAFNTHGTRNGGRILTILGYERETDFAGTFLSYSR